MLFKKILFTNLLIATSSSIAFAATPYVGGSLGVTNLGIHQGGHVQAGAIGKLFGGEGTIVGANKNIYLGGELNLDLAHYPYQTGFNYGLGASFIPGLMLTKYTMVYGRIGLELERNNHSATTYFSNQLGLGLQTAMQKNWDVRGEYIHTSNFGGNSQVNLGLVYKFDR